MPITTFIPEHLLRDQLGNYNYPVDSLISVKGGRRVVSFTGAVLGDYTIPYYESAIRFAVVYNARLNVCDYIILESPRQRVKRACVVDSTTETRNAARGWLYRWFTDTFDAIELSMIREIKPGRIIEFIKPYNPTSPDRLAIEIGQLAWVESLLPDPFSPVLVKAQVIFTHGPSIGLRSIQPLDKLAVALPDMYRCDLPDFDLISRNIANSEKWDLPFTTDILRSINT
jgi:hypothetical protein